MAQESQQQYHNRQAIELLAQHIPFETDPAMKAEYIEELRALVLRVGRDIDRAVFGFEARQELRRLGLWDYFIGNDLPDDEISYGHGRSNDDER